MRQKRYLKTVSILMIFDVTVLFIPVFDSPDYLRLIGLIFHIVLGIWGGRILNWILKSSEKKTYVVTTSYWIIFGLTILGPNIMLVLAQWLIALVNVMKATFAENEKVDLEEHPIAPDKHPNDFHLKKVEKGKWPLPVAVLLLIGILLVNFIMALSNKGEFGGLGLLFLHLFIFTPFFLITPALLRIPAADNIKPSVKLMQFFVYVLLTISWFMLLLVN